MHTHFCTTILFASALSLVNGSFIPNALKHIRGGGHGNRIAGVDIDRRDADEALPLAPVLAPTPPGELSEECQNNICIVPVDEAPPGQPLSCANNAECDSANLGCEVGWIDGCVQGLCGCHPEQAVCEGDECGGADVEAGPSSCGSDSECDTAALGCAPSHTGRCVRGLCGCQPGPRMCSKDDECDLNCGSTVKARCVLGACACPHDPPPPPPKPTKSKKPEPKPTPEPKFRVRVVIAFKEVTEYPENLLNPNRGTSKPTEWIVFAKRPGESLNMCKDETWFDYTNAGSITLENRILPARLTARREIYGLKGCEFIKGPALPGKHGYGIMRCKGGVQTDCEGPKDKALEMCVEWGHTDIHYELANCYFN